MTHFDAADFSECHSEVVKISFDAHFITRLIQDEVQIICLPVTLIASLFLLIPTLWYVVSRFCPFRRVDHATYAILTRSSPENLRL